MEASQPVIHASNRGFRYGDGLFETMKIENAKIQLATLHFDRLFAGIKLLKFQLPVFITPQHLTETVLQLCEKNKCLASARVRLSVFRGNGSLFDADTPAEYIMECWPLEQALVSFNEQGLLLDFFPDVKKSCDEFANLKSTSHLPYVMAAAYAQEKGLDDCLVLNHFGRVADTSIANIFLIKNKTIYTPSLAEGCIAGVMRQHLISLLKAKEMEVCETAISLNDVMEADELFVTNAIRGIKWVYHCNEKVFSNNVLKLLMQELNYLLS